MTYICMEILIMDYIILLLYDIYVFKTHLSLAYIILLLHDIHMYGNIDYGLHNIATL